MKIFIWGAGRVGRSYARRLESLEGDDFEVLGAWNRSFGRALESSLLLDCEVCAGDALPEQFIKADVVIISVSDDAVAETAARLAPHLSRRQILLHTSGSLAASVLEVEGMKAGLGCLHPLQSLADPQGSPDHLKGIVFGIDGEERAVELASKLADAMGGKPVVLPSDKKVYYHLSAVIAANYTTVLSSIAATCAAEAGLDTATAIEMLEPLILGTLQNHQQKATSGLEHALTGPIARGDLGTVKRHLKALRKADKGRDTPSLREIYAHVGLHGLELASKKGLESNKVDEISTVLRRQLPGPKKP